MELRHLRYFVAVAEDLHFRRAAERLHVAQPAVSEQIRKLEAELGVRLFDRTPRSVRLTEAGRVMLEEARRVLRQAEQAALAARNADAQANLPLRIGYVADALPAVVPRTLRHLVAAAPAVRMRLETGSAARLLDEVRGGALDVAVVGLPAPTAGLRVTPLGSEPLVVVLPAADGRTQDGPLELRRLGLDRVVVPPRDANPALHAAIVAACHGAGLAPALVEAAEPRVDLVLLMVAAGTGAALLPASVAEQHPLPGLRAIPLAGDGPRFASAVVSSPDSERLATRTFLRALEHVARRTARPALQPVAA
ncbi:MAG: LysR family transcriptional regulator [Solirubrobacteraceae bacterium]|nr:LysR family transcriptional regulator [Solirubrobacteraceae bacterium]